MRNKKLINRRNDIAQGWQFCSPSWKRKGKKEIKSYYNTGIRIWSPIQILTLRNRAYFDERTKYVAVLVV